MLYQTSLYRLLSLSTRYISSSAAYTLSGSSKDDPCRDAIVSLPRPLLFTPAARARSPVKGSLGTWHNKDYYACVNFHVHISPVVEWVAYFLTPVMTTKLFYTPGDPDYLKVVLLRDIFGVPVTSFETVEGESDHFKLFVHSANVYPACPGSIKDWSCMLFIGIILCYDII